MDRTPIAGVSRLSHLREDPNALTLAFGQRERRYWFVNEGRFWLSSEDASAFGHLDHDQWSQRIGGTRVLLGMDDHCVYFACDPTEAKRDRLGPATHWVSLRERLALLSAQHTELAMMAQSLIHWHQHHRFCGQCGHATQSEREGHLLRCVQSACGHVVFPRLDPAIIVQVTAGDEILLGRQKSWPQGRYSTLAGFVEAGETLEQAVVREVWEETGVVVHEPKYMASQPWPFPSSLMLGFTAQAQTRAIHCNDGELEDARWFSVTDIEQRLITLPSPVSISHRLIQHWYHTRTGRALPHGL